MTLFTREVIPRVRAQMGVPEVGGEPVPVVAGLSV
jgi:hypothetical protein